jgi:hypothetical protein
MESTDSISKRQFCYSSSPVCLPPLSPELDRIPLPLSARQEGKQMSKEAISTAEQEVERVSESPAHCSIPPIHEDSLFLRQNDYWIIRFHGRNALLKSTRGLDCLCYLLRRPALDVHVGELLATPIDVRVPAFFQDAGPILDSQAKAEYKRQIDELRNDLKEAERLNDSYRATRARSEMDAIARKLAAAVALGGRNRRFSSGAERARSAVTKRIKEAISRIGKAMPALGRHLAARIKTGYFCSYNPHPDRPVAWKF